MFPQAIAYTGLTATEVPTVCFSLAILWAILHTQKSSHPASSPWGYWALLGLVLYGGALIRMTLLLYVLVLPPLFWRYRREHFAQWMKRFSIMLATLGLLLSTWALHQQTVSDGKTWFFGHTAWLTNVVQYQSEGRYVAPEQLSFYPKLKPYLTAKNAAIVHRGYELMEEESIQIIREDPLKYLQYGFVRLYHILHTAQTGIRWTQKGSAALQTVPKKMGQKALHSV